MSNIKKSINIITLIVFHSFIISCNNNNDEKKIRAVINQVYEIIKPYLIEGEIFASLYEGYVFYSITNISIEKTVL